MPSPGSGRASASAGTSKELCLARLQLQVDVSLGCSRCTQRLNESTYLLRALEHRCAQEILLARKKGAAPSTAWRKVDRRPRFPRPARYVVCRYYQPGLGCQRHRNRCTFAHSEEEALVWNLERDFGLHWPWLKVALKGGTAQTSPADAILVEFGGHFQEFCTYCFRRCPPCLSPVDAKGECRTHRACLAMLAHVSAEGHRKQQVVEVRQQPQAGWALAYCMYVADGRPCRHGVTRCQFAHSAVEMAVWKAERHDGLQRGDLLKALAPEAPADQTPSVHLYCQACLVSCESVEAFENHCASLEHSQMVALEPVTNWEHRSPPTGLSTFELCPRPELCEYGRLCTKAHSPQELLEWTRRADIIRLREEDAWREGLVSYQARLLDEYQRSSNKLLVLAESVEGVSAACDQPLLHRAKHRVTEHSWTFTLESKKPLEHVALLRQEPGATFWLAVPGLGPGQQYARGERFLVPGAGRHHFRVTVHVLSASFGTFEQWLVFSFGHLPALLRKLTLQLGQEPCLEVPGQSASDLQQPLERWHTGNRQVVPGVERKAEEAALLAKYKVPDLVLKLKHGCRDLEPISCANYRQRMHQFLFEEETAQQQLVAKLNLQAPVALKQTLETPALGMQFAPQGDLYAEVSIPSSLTPDTDQGFLLSWKVNTALVAPVPAPDLRVFEVRLEKKASSDRTLWLLLPAHCCQALGLQANTSPVLEVQFQIDQLIFCRWHQAVDALADERLVVPDLQLCALPRARNNLPLVHGNRKQKLAIEAILGDKPSGSKPVAPLLIYGPFGTGKTYTLAMATLEVVKRPHTRVLICTHTNSAADIYIHEHFHGYVSSGHPEAAPLRVMYMDRPPSQTDAVTLLYCCLSPDRRAFRPPSPAELQKHRIVVTTTAQARNLPVAPGFFSHILIDEAAQMLECEALMPLGHAVAGTRVVLAGDHMQLTPRLFSVAQGQAANHTLLYRLFLHYQQQPQEQAQNSRIIFHENYRSTDAIINFVGRYFYVAKGSPIHASGKVPRHPRLYPLMFCHVAGPAERDLSLASWLNPAEVSQVVEKVREILGSWPHCWGACDQKRVCVVSHGAQVSALRQELRKCYMGQVSVGSFEILPGREFRVVVLSTVHTHHSLLDQGAPTPEVFTDPRVLNTILTRAQSQVVVVGDAVALCSVGACSKLWKCFIRDCMEHHSVCPPDLSLEQIETSVRRRWAHGVLQAPGSTTRDPVAGPRTEEAVPPPDPTADTSAQKAEARAVVSLGPVTAANMAPEKLEEAAAGNGKLMGPEDTEETESDFWLFEGELDPEDSILKELLDESLKMAVTVREDGLLDTVVRPTSWVQAGQYTNLPLAILQSLLRSQPKLYHRCTFVQDTFHSATAVPLDAVGSETIQLCGRLNCGMAFTGDEVVVKVIKQVPRQPQGCVVGVLQRRQRELVFVCRMDEWDSRIMTPIDNSVTKIFVAELRDPREVPLHRLVRGRLQRVGTKRLALSERHTRLFLVRVVVWRARFYYPLGIILEVLPEASTWEHGLHALDLEYGLRPLTPEPGAVSQALQRFRGQLDKASKQRQDCRNFLTFTVDPQDACNLDDALSVRDLGPRYEVAVHITDVASCVHRGGALDVEAHRRGSTFYAPEREPVLMLPASLCQSALSLLPGQDRLAISLFFTVEKGSDQLKDVRFALSLIRSDHQLSYEDAERLIRGHPESGFKMPASLNSLGDCVAAACYFSRVLRERRLQHSCYYERPDEDSGLGFRAAHTMIQEYMIQFNSHVAEFLVGSKATQDVTPLRWQQALSKKQLETLSEKHRTWLPLSLQMKQRLGDLCPPASAAEAQLPLLTAFWRHIQLAAQEQDLPLLVDLVTTDDLHPTLMPVMLDYRRAQNRSAFYRSGQRKNEPLGKNQPLGHYSLQVDWYTWASSPIRRYLDVVLQRQLLLVLGQGGVAYSAGDIDRLCQEFSHQQVRAQGYQRRAQNLHLATQLKVQPQEKLGFVVDVEPGARCFKLLFPGDRESLPEPCPVFYRSLLLAEHPLMEPRLHLMWRRRIYSLQKDEACLPLPGALLDPHCQPVASGMWQQLLELVQEQRWPEAMALVKAQQVATPRPRQLGWVQWSKCKLFVEVSLDLCAGDVLQVQLSPALQRGFLAPVLQLWTVAPGLSVCLEHADRPENCFSGQELRPGQDRYHNLDEYLSVWQPFCTLETILGAVVENESITLQGVKIFWVQEQTAQKQMQGTFYLDATFLLQYSINISFDQCYLCIRLEGLKAAQSPACQGLVPAVTMDPGTFTWVAHALTVENEDQDSRSNHFSSKYVNFFIQHMAMEKAPDQVFEPDARFTIEVLPKQLPDIRKEEALRNLPKASKLITSIALGQPLTLPSQSPRQPPLHRGVYSRFLEQRAFDIPQYRHKLNPSQNTAVREALRKQFTVIQGPPGTGKTVVALHIVFWFHKCNDQVLDGSERRRSGPHILYCGPSNKSVDVLAGMLLSWMHELKPLRVYGEQAEATEFPTPGVGSRGLSKKSPGEGRPNQALRSISLHHRIRQPSNPYSAELKAFDTRLQSGEILSIEDLKRYRSVLLKARKYELVRHRVILCTCSCSAAGYLSDLDVKQVLIDEAGMATEPEILIPLVTFFKTEKVVLLGDHKQLRPVVKNDSLQKLGLDRSLFERYYQDAFMLDTQYRMHRDICAFPSMEFYQNRLKTWPNLQRQPSVLGHPRKNSCPVIFGHMQGHEKSLLVCTEEGNENSKANLEEVDRVVRIANQLVLGGILARDIAILTPYNAQAAEISKKLALKGIRGMTVSSITKSQGSEWRYVLVSTVRSCPEIEVDQRPTKGWMKKFLGFVTDPNQMNVAITRAQEGLCFIGDHLLLRCCPLWRRLLDFCEAQGGLVPAEQIRVQRRAF